MNECFICGQPAPEGSEFCSNYCKAYASDEGRSLNALQRLTRRLANELPVASDVEEAMRSPATPPTEEPTR